jgi:hypothetical protein
LVARFWEWIDATRMRRRAWFGGLSLIVLAAGTIMILQVTGHSPRLADAAGGVGGAGAAATRSGGPSSDPRSPTPSRTTASPKPAATTPSIGPTAVPPITSACPPFPAFPDSNCTGYKHTGVTLHTCSVRITTANSTYDSCLFPDTLTIAAKGVTVKRSLVQGRVEGVNSSLQGATLIDVEIDGGGNPDHNQSAITETNYTCIRCDIHSTGHGAHGALNVTIRDSYIHDFVYSAGAHQTAFGSNGGSHFVLVHNNLQCNSNGEGCSSALSFYGDDSQVNDVLVQNNLFNTDGSYCTYAGSVASKAYPHGVNVRYVDNRFGKKFHSRCGSYGPVTSWEQGSSNVWQGNAWQDGSGPVLP